MIRYSQLLHYACVHSDTTMIDFLISRGASLDLNGHYLKYGAYRYGEQGYEAIYEWNSDTDYFYTPVDQALRHKKFSIVRYIGEKYHKYPTIYGVCYYFCTYIIPQEMYDFINNVSPDFNFMDKVDYTIEDVLNFGYHYYKKVGNTNVVYTSYLVNNVVQLIADLRKKQKHDDADSYFELLKFLVDKGARLNVEEDKGQRSRLTQSVGVNVVGYVNTTPLTIALTNENMLDVVQYLLEKGASTTTIVNGQRVSIVKGVGGVRDEYKEYLMLEGLY